MPDYNYGIFKYLLFEVTLRLFCHNLTYHHTGCKLVGLQKQKFRILKILLQNKILWMPSNEI